MMLVRGRHTPLIIGACAGLGSLGAGALVHRAVAGANQQHEAALVAAEASWPAAQGEGSSSGGGRPPLPPPGAAQQSPPPPLEVAAAAAAPTLQGELARLRPQLEDLRALWASDEAGWRKLPARAWPGASLLQQ